MIVNKCTRENSETVGRDHTESRTDNKGAPRPEAGRNSDGGKLGFIPCFSEKKGNGYRPEKGLIKVFFSLNFSSLLLLNSVLAPKARNAAAAAI